ncbi:MAG: PAS domain S-box protein, partial [Acetobacteraceae bacterium]
VHQQPHRGQDAAALLARRILTPVRLLVDQAVAVAAGQRALPPPGTPPANVAEFEALRVASAAAARTLEAREAEFRSIFETAAAGVVEIDARSLRYLRVNRRFCTISGRTEAALVGGGLRPDDICHPDDLGRNAVSEVLAQGIEAEAEVRLLRPDGAVAWVRASAAVSARAADGSPLRIVSVVRDVTERRRAEQARELLAREVDHRAKNALAVVQAVVRLTPKDTLASYAKAVEARINALARTHTLLANGRWAGTELHSLARAELGAFLPDPAKASPGKGGTTLAGPVVMLSPAASQAISMVLHELATNATKYGALSAPGGAVHLHWSVDEAQGHLTLNWEERGGPPVTGPPARLGFGSKVIEATMRDQLGGEASQCWKTEGLVCRIRVPLERILAGLEPKGEASAAIHAGSEAAPGH